MADAALSELEAASYGGARARAPPEQPEVSAGAKRQRTERAAALDAAELLAEAERELADAGEDGGAQQVDTNAMKLMVLGVERRINENMQMRMKYPDRPEKFLDSELELFQELKRLHVLATAPEVYPSFVKTKCVPSLLGLLSHENADISADVIDLIHELTDADDADPSDTLALVECLVENGAGGAVMQHMEALDESNDEVATTIHAALSIFESFIEAKPTLATDLAKKDGLMKWLLKRIKVPWPCRPGLPWPPHGPAA